jgi:predicted metal-dependent phosphoesterase TrpH
MMTETMTVFKHIDLHTHSEVSDGTDTPEMLLEHVKEAGIDLFSLTDHDAVKGAQRICQSLKAGDPCFITGAEFSCKDQEGKYHILGYGYDPDSEPIRKLVKKAHSYRMDKVKSRLFLLKEKFGITFPESELAALWSLDNPGKPHIGNLMVRYGYVKTKEEGIEEYINKVRTRTEYVKPEEAIRGIAEAGGIPVLAHPSYGDGDQLILGDEMDARIRRLLEFGLKGLEGFYSGFTKAIRGEILDFAERYGLYVTAGSDYHGGNKIVRLGDTGLTDETEWPDGLRRFVKDVRISGQA